MYIYKYIMCVCVRVTSSGSDLDDGGDRGLNTIKNTNIVTS